MKKKILLIAGGMFCIFGSLNAQCTFTGLNPTYCENDTVVTLTPPGAGIFSGPGITGNDFDPGLAGPGIHQVDYDESDPTLYTIDQTGTYAPLVGPGTPISLNDDQVSAALPLNFTFNFFGVNYTDFYISSNGFITFTNDPNSGCCSGQLIPNASTPNNLIAFSWDDMYPPGFGSIDYYTTGTAPNQMLVMNFNDIPFCCGTTAAVKTQVILYETTNAIEIHTEYANGLSPGTMGIENVDGTIAFAVPGRNSSAWPSLVNDYVAFYPAVCSSFQTVEVYPSPNVIGTVDINPACVGDAVTFTGSGADSYTWDMGITNGAPYPVSASGTHILTGVESVYGCAGMDTIYMVVNPNPTISLSANDEMLGNDGSINLTILSGPAPFIFDWNNDGVGDNDDSNDLYGVASGTYSVTMTDGNGCTTTDSATIGSQVGLEDLSGIEFSIHPNPSNGIFTVKLAKENVGNSVHIIIVNMLGQRIFSEAVIDNTINVNISDNKAGMYYVKIVSEEGTSVAPIVLK